MPAQLQPVWLDRANTDLDDAVVSSVSVGGQSTNCPSSPIAASSERIRESAASSTVSPGGGRRTATIEWADGAVAAAGVGVAGDGSPVTAIVSPIQRAPVQGAITEIGE